MTLIAPGTWIEPIGTDWWAPGIFRARPIEIVQKSYLCTDLYPMDFRCPACKGEGGGMWLEVEDYPAFAFCATHWRPLYRPKASWEEQLKTWEPVQDEDVSSPVPDVDRRVRVDSLLPVDHAHSHRGLEVVESPSLQAAAYHHLYHLPVRTDRSGGCRYRMVCEQGPQED